MVLRRRKQERSPRSIYCCLTLLLRWPIKNTKMTSSDVPILIFLICSTTVAVEVVNLSPEQKEQANKEKYAFHYSVSQIHIIPEKTPK